MMQNGAVKSPVSADLAERLQNYGIYYEQVATQMRQTYIEAVKRKEAAQKKIAELSNELVDSVLMTSSRLTQQLADIHVNQVVHIQTLQSAAVFMSQQFRGLQEAEMTDEELISQVTQLDDVWNSIAIDPSLIEDTVNNTSVEKAAVSFRDAHERVADCWAYVKHLPVHPADLVVQLKSSHGLVGITEFSVLDRSQNGASGSQYAYDDIFANLAIEVHLYNTVSVPFNSYKGVSANGEICTVAFVPNNPSGMYTVKVRLYGRDITHSPATYHPQSGCSMESLALQSQQDLLMLSPTSSQCSVATSVAQGTAAPMVSVSRSQKPMVRAPTMSLAPRLPTTRVPRFANPAAGGQQPRLAHAGSNGLTTNGGFSDIMPVNPGAAHRPRMPTLRKPAAPSASQDSLVAAPAASGDGHFMGGKNAFSSAATLQQVPVGSLLNYDSDDSDLPVIDKSLPKSVRPPLEAQPKKSILKTNSKSPPLAGANLVVGAASKVAMGYDDPGASTSVGGFGRGRKATLEDAGIPGRRNAASCDDSQDDIDRLVLESADLSLVDPPAFPMSSGAVKRPPPGLTATPPADDRLDDYGCVPATQQADSGGAQSAYVEDASFRPLLRDMLGDQGFITGKEMLRLGTPKQFEPLERCLHNPIGCTYDEWNQRYVVCDTSHGVVKVFNAEGRPFAMFGGTKDLNMHRPSAVLVLEDKTYVIREDDGIHHVDENGMRIATFGKKSELSRPYGLARDSTGNIVTLSHCDEQGPTYIARFDPRNHERVFELAPHQPSIAEAKGNARKPRPRFMDAFRDTLVVSDLGVHKVYVSDMEGNKVCTFGKQGRQVPGAIDQPSGVALDRGGDILLGDAGNHRVQVFGQNGDYMGAVKLDSRLARPSDIYLNRAGHLMVMNLTEHFVTVFKLS